MQKFAHIPGVHYPDPTPATPARRPIPPGEVPPGYIPTQEAARRLVMTPSATIRRLRDCGCLCHRVPMLGYYWHEATVNTLANHRSVHKTLPVGYLPLAASAEVIGCSRATVDKLIARHHIAIIRYKSGKTTPTAISQRDVHRLATMYKTSSPRHHGANH